MFPVLPQILSHSRGDNILGEDWIKSHTSYSDLATNIDHSRVTLRDGSRVYCQGVPYKSKAGSREVIRYVGSAFVINPMHPS